MSKSNTKLNIFSFSKKNDRDREYKKLLSLNCFDEKPHIYDVNFASSEPYRLEVVSNIHYVLEKNDKDEIVVIPYISDSPIINVDCNVPTNSNDNVDAPQSDVENMDNETTQEDKNTKTNISNNIRGISVLLRDATESDVEKLKEYCLEHRLFYRFRYAKDKNMSLLYDDYKKTKVIPLFYFWITSNTKGYEELNAFMDNRLLLTDFAEYGNIADKDEKFMEDTIVLINYHRKVVNEVNRSHRILSDYIKQIDDVDTLVALNSMFGVYFDDFEKYIIQSRIDVIKGEKEHFEEAMMESILSSDSDVLKLRTLTGMSRKDFSKYFNIPYRTIEDWENKKSTCSSYLYSLMKYRLEKDGYIHL